VQVELLAPRTLGLIGPVLAEDADRLLDAIASLAPGGPITLDLTGVTSIDEGGVAAIRRRAPRGLCCWSRDEDACAYSGGGQSVTC